MENPGASVQVTSPFTWGLQHPGLWYPSSWTLDMEGQGSDGHPAEHQAGTLPWGPGCPLWCSPVCTALSAGGEAPWGPAPGAGAPWPYGGCWADPQGAARMRPASTQKSKRSHVEPGGLHVGWQRGRGLIGVGDAHGHPEEVRREVRGGGGLATGGHIAGQQKGLSWVRGGKARREDGSQGGQARAKEAGVVQGWRW